MRYRVLLALLHRIAALAIWRHRPKVVAVTGSVGKTSTRRAIMTTLRAQHHDRVRGTVGNRNTEIGVPLAILGLTPGGKSPVKWALRILQGLGKALFDPEYPDVLVLEMSAETPGNIARLAALAPPSVTVVTEIGEIPRHVEHYAGPKNFAREQARLIEALPLDGWAILNGEDASVAAMRERTGAHVRTYGFADEGEFDVRAMGYEVSSGSQGSDQTPQGVRFKIEYRGKIIPVRLTGTLGQGIVRAALAGAATGIALGMNLVEISEALTSFEGPPGRLRLRSGVRRSTIIDDTYDASPPSLRLALGALQQAPAKRRIAVLGDLEGLGRYSEAAHQAAGERAASVADVVITVGNRMRFASEEALRHGATPADVRHVSQAHEATALLKDYLAPGDVALITGARNMGMEQIVEAVSSS